jgi:hypothetical protein
MLLVAKSAGGGHLRDGLAGRFEQPLRAFHATSDNELMRRSIGRSLELAAEIYRVETGS